MAVFLTVLRILEGQGPGRIGLGGYAAFFAVVAVGGAVGGVTWYSTDALRVQGGARKTFANVLTLLVYSLVVFAAVLLTFGTPQ